MAKIDYRTMATRLLSALCFATKKMPPASLVIDERFFWLHHFHKMPRLELAYLAIEGFILLIRGSRKQWRFSRLERRFIVETTTHV